MSKSTKILFISFDVYRTGEIKKSYAVASVVAYLRHHLPALADSIQAITFDVSKKWLTRGVLWEAVKAYPFRGVSGFNPRLKPEAVIRSIRQACDLRSLEYFFLPDYVWSKDLTNEVIRLIKKAGFRGKTVLAGYEITATPDSNMLRDYPDADYFIKGYAEEAALQLISGQVKHGHILSIPVDAQRLASVYLTKEMPIGPQTKMVRWETKRGCPYACKFCEHSQMPKDSRKPSELPLKRLKEELELFRCSNINKVNVLDPTFNVGDHYLDCLKMMTDTPSIQFSLQIRAELIRGKKGERFLELCNQGKNIHLELGVQTIVPQEMDAIGRDNNVEQIGTVLDRLKSIGIPFETNLIYGIPGQTVESFRKSIDFLISHGCPHEKIRAFPLHIPKASCIPTKDRQIVEGPVHEANCSLQVVTASSSFTSREWLKMLFEAGSLEKGETETKKTRNAMDWLLKFMDKSDEFSGFHVSFTSRAGKVETAIRKPRLYFRFESQGNKWKPLTPDMFAHVVGGLTEEYSGLSGIKCRTRSFGKSYTVARARHKHQLVWIVLETERRKEAI